MEQQPSEHSEQELSTKEHILKVTHDFIMKTGFEAVTTRKIAALANVNIAMVNYYFGSKDKLLNETIKAILNSYKGCFAILDQTELPAKERLKRFLTDYAKTFQRYPDLLRQIVKHSSFPFESQFEFAHFVKTMGFPKILTVLQEITQEADSNKLIMTGMQIFGALLFPILMEPLISGIYHCPLPDIEQQVEEIMSKMSL
ncbi:TetR/AcrR family transcriptional regulator [Paenibacillus aceti]|uniref:TetR/AcrR family transcriptional regulator n=1 Tax=Paenibacillus aceti TaxID=1820010 RepID=UPI000EA2D799|nr:TetR/AcrR family transcriptional regulator [Paenibacillus aceti]